MANFALLHGYWDISNFYISIELYQYLTISVFNYNYINLIIMPALWKYGRDCSIATPKKWAWLNLEPSLLQFLEITSAKS